MVWFFYLPVYVEAWCVQFVALVTPRVLLHNMCSMRRRNFGRMMMVHDGSATEKLRKVWCRPIYLFFVIFIDYQLNGYVPVALKGGKIAKMQHNCFDVLIELSFDFWVIRGRCQSFGAEMRANRWGERSGAPCAVVCLFLRRYFVWDNSYFTVYIYHNCCGILAH